MPDSTLHFLRDNQSLKQATQKRFSAYAGYFGI